MTAARLAWIAVLLVALSHSVLCGAMLGARTVRIYPYLVEPSEVEYYDLRPVRPPGREVFGDTTGFAATRAIGDDYMQQFDSLDKSGLGRVLWPSYSFLFSPNLEAIVTEIKQRGYLVTDVWDYVPGDATECAQEGGNVCQVKPPREALDLLEEMLGGKFTGMDVGEQDGRYVGGYAKTAQPLSSSRRDRRLHFHTHFEKMAKDLGYKLATLMSLSYAHHLVKSGYYTSLGSESAQALPSGMMFHSMLRGAGKQHGMRWFGNSSIYSRFGVKNYSSQSEQSGPTKGTSLALMKRLMYAQVMYNSAYIGFEAGWQYENGTLTPIGVIQTKANEFVKEHAASIGQMLTTVALMVDIDSGFTPPRQLYNTDVYKVWGALPYGPGDHLTHAVFGMVWPRYEDSSYFRNETGFMTATPYSDNMDVIMSDSRPKHLREYNTIIIATALTTSAPGIAARLEDYVADGGHVVITAGSIAGIGGIMGVTSSVAPGRCVAQKPGTVVVVDGTPVTERAEFDLCPLYNGAGDGITVTTVASIKDQPAVVKLTLKDSNGSVTILLSPYAINSHSVASHPITSDVDTRLAQPFPMLKHAEVVLDGILKSSQLFSANPDLGLVVNRVDPGRYSVTLFNNNLKQMEMNLESLIGSVTSLRELPLDYTEVSQIGYLPEGFEKSDLGSNTNTTIAGATERIFIVDVDEEGIVVLPKVPDVPRVGDAGMVRVGVRVAGRSPIAEEVWRRTTFIDHFESLSVDWRGLVQRSEDSLREDADWARRHKIDLRVDASSGIDLFPDLRLVNNSAPDEYQWSQTMLAQILHKASLIGAKDVIVSLHRVPENGYDEDQTNADFVSSIKALCTAAQAAGITLHLRVTDAKLPSSFKDAVAFVMKCNCGATLKLAPQVGTMVAWGVDALDLQMACANNLLGLWLLSAAYPDDLQGGYWSTAAPISDPAVASQYGIIGQYLNTTPGVPIILDAAMDHGGDDAGIYEAEVMDARQVQRLVIALPQPPATTHGGNLRSALAPATFI